MTLSISLVIEFFQLVAVVLGLTDMVIVVDLRMAQVGMTFHHEMEQWIVEVVVQDLGTIKSEAGVGPG